jgi:hypothetical protein
MVKDSQATISLTGSQIDAMVRRDQQREVPLSAPAAKMREREWWGSPWRYPPITRSPRSGWTR